MSSTHRPSTIALVAWLPACVTCLAYVACAPSAPSAPTAPIAPATAPAVTIDVAPAPPEKTPAADATGEPTAPPDPRSGADGSGRITSPTEPPGGPKPTGPIGDVAIGTLTTTGPIPDLERSVAGTRARLRACYQRGLSADPTLKGKVDIVIEVDANGAVTSARASASSGMSDAVAQCMAGVARRVPFSMPTARSARISIPVVCTIR